MLAPSGRRIDERGADMKKKLAALLCAAMLACALPALAWADEAAEPTADQATAQESAAARSIGPWQESASNEDGSCVLSGEARASSFAVIATSETADDALDGMPSFRVVAENATKKIDFGDLAQDRHGRRRAGGRLLRHAGRRRSRGLSAAPQAREVTDAHRRAGVPQGSPARSSKGGRIGACATSPYTYSRKFLHKRGYKSAPNRIYCFQSFKSGTERPTR